VRRLDFAPRCVALYAIAVGIPLLVCVSRLARAEDAADPPGDAGATPAAPGAAAPGAAALPVRQVGEVVATATRAEQNVLDVAGNVTVIDRAEIDRSGARDVPELLRREAGIFVANTTGSPEGYMVEARGFNNGGGNGSSLLVLVDGRRINEADSGIPDWSGVRIDDVERIEVVRGPVSALWGDNAMSGVVQIFTRRASGAPEVVARGRVGSYDLLDGSLFGGGSAGPLSITAYGEGYDSDDFRKRSDYRDWNGSTVLRYTPTDALSFEVSTGTSRDDRQRPGSLSKSQLRLLGRDGVNPQTRANNDNVEDLWVQGHAVLTPTEHVTLQFLPYWRERSDNALNATFEEAPSTTTSTDFSLERHTTSWGGTLQGQIDRPVLGFGNRLVAGTDLLNDAADSASLYTYATTGPPASTSEFPDHSTPNRRVWGAFVEDELSLTRDLILSAGLRYDRAKYSGHSLSAGGSFDRFFEQWSPRASLTWRFLPGTSAYVSYSRGFRFPNFDEAFGVFGYTPQLNPMRSNSYEIGVKHRGQKLSATLALYWMEVQDEIFFNPESVSPVTGFAGQNVNIDRTRHRGVEASFSYRPQGWIELYGSYTLTDAQIVHDSTSALANLDGNRFPITPENMGTVGGILFLPHAFELGSNVNLVGRRYLASDVQNQFVKLPAYSTVDLTVAWKPRISEHVELAIQGRVLNVFAEKYFEFGGVSTTNLGFIGYDVGNERNWDLSLTVTYR
jgi:iron complex outermembrane receptor protein